jgi:hypothetical protein
LSSLIEAIALFRQELGMQVYGSMGISRDDQEGRLLAVLRNYEFFGAPIVGIDFVDDQPVYLMQNKSI